MEFPKCCECGSVMVTLSDFGFVPGVQHAAQVLYRSWCCTNRKCRLMITSKGGETFFGTAQGQPHETRHSR